MNSLLKKAITLREEVTELDGLIFEANWHGDEEDEETEQKAELLWQQHVELLKQIYPKPDPRDHIHATILDTYRDDAIVLKTSFANMCEYNKAQDQLGWDYSLTSEQVDQCELCDQYYLTKDGTQTAKQGFCSTDCLKENEFERQRWAKDDYYEYYEWYDYNFPNGCDLRDTPQW